MSIGVTEEGKADLNFSTLEGETISLPGIEWKDMLDYGMTVIQASMWCAMGAGATRDEYFDEYSRLWREAHSEE